MTATPTYTRFEDASGDGLFLVAARFLDHFEDRSIRVPRQLRRDLAHLKYDLWRLTSPVPGPAYQDHRSRRPITWFVGDSTQLQLAHRLVHLLNRYGANIRRIQTQHPPPVLWTDGVQAVTRGVRRPPRKVFDLLWSRHRDRRTRQQRRREKVRYRRARALKSGFPLVE